MLLSFRALREQGRSGAKPFGTLRSFDIGIALTLHRRNNSPASQMKKQTSANRHAEHMHKQRQIVMRLRSTRRSRWRCFAFARARKQRLHLRHSRFKESQSDYCISAATPWCLAWVLFVLERDGARRCVSAQSIASRRARQCAPRCRVTCEH